MISHIIFIDEIMFDMNLAPTLSTTHATLTRPRVGCVVVRLEWQTRLKWSSCEHNFVDEDNTIGRGAW